MRGHVQPISDGVWRLWIENGRDPLTGRRRRLTVTYHGTEPEAEEEAARLVLAVRDGQHATAPTTFGALLDRWLEHSEPNLAPWTIRGYRSKIETHIRPALGDLKLRQVTSARLDEFYRALLKRGRRRTVHNDDGTTKVERVGLSAQSIRHIHAIIHRACEQGRRWEWLDRNPAELAEPPTVAVRARTLPPVAEIVAVLERLTPDMRELVLLAIVSGARRGELCGLVWADLDLDAGQVTISRSVADTAEAVIVKSTKTGKVRRLAIDAITVAMLKARHAAQVEKALACGIRLEPSAFVFGDQPGAAEPLRPALVTKRWANAARAGGLACTFHDLRHVAVTELLDAGFDVSGVSARVGHASAKMTLDQYGHTRRAGDLASSEHLAGLLQQTTPV